MGLSYASATQLHGWQLLPELSSHIGQALSMAEYLPINSNLSVPHATRMAVPLPSLRASANRRHANAHDVRACNSSGPHGVHERLGEKRARPLESFVEDITDGEAVPLPRLRRTKPAAGAIITLNKACERTPKASSGGGPAGSIR